MRSKKQVKAEAKKIKKAIEKEDDPRDKEVYEAMLLVFEWVLAEVE